jgi:predicted ATPase/transcriptional regulator with XRE-family HTH domain
MGEINASFGELLLRFRSATGLTQEALAERSGLSRTGVGDLERGFRQAPRLETVRLLADALDLSPSDRRALLAAARPALLQDRPAEPSPSARPRVPIPLTRLIGREGEIAILRAVIPDRDVRLVTVTGPGGVGKTRVALAAAAAVAEEFADGAAFVPLAAITDPERVLSAIARTLGIRETFGRPLPEVLVTALRDRHLVLVLDNFEHVLPAAVEVGRLLEACPLLTVLVTSRSPLRLRGERRVALSPLAVPNADEGVTLDGLVGYEAITLFVERARSVQHDFAFDLENAAAVVEICRRLDGLPLAIELAAAWTHLFVPADLLAHLERRLPLLRGGGDDLPVRLRTMRDAIAWSYDLLSPDEARFFRRLAVFVGGFTIEGASWLWNIDPSSTADQPTSREEVLDALSGLIDKSLVQPTPEGPEPRFGMLETVREFALEQLANSGEAAAVAAAHGACMLTHAEAMEPVLLGPQERYSQALCDAELGNVRAALAWALTHDIEVALRVAGALWVYWAWYQIAEGRRWLEAAVPSSSDSPALVRAKAYTTLGALAVLEGDGETGSDAGSAAVALVDQAVDPVPAALARWIAACGHFYTVPVAPAIPDLDQALALFEQASTSTDRSWAAYACSHRGVAALMMGEEDKGLAFFEAALAQTRAVGSDGITLLILGDFAGWLIDLGQTGRARGMLQEALALAMDHHGVWLKVVIFSSLALVDAIEGEAANSARRLGASSVLWVRAGLAIPAHYQHRIDRATGLATAVLGEAAFAALWRAGRAAPDAVIRAALDQPAENHQPVLNAEHPPSGRVARRKE